MKKESKQTEAVQKFTRLPGHNYKRLLLILSSFFIIVAIAATVVFIGTNQDIRQRAASSANLVTKSSLLADSTLRSTFPATQQQSAVITLPNLITQSDVQRWEPVANTDENQTIVYTISPTSASRQFVAEADINNYAVQIGEIDSSSTPINLARMQVDIYNGSSLLSAPTIVEIRNQPIPPSQTSQISSNVPFTVPANATAYVLVRAFNAKATFNNIAVCEGASCGRNLVTGTLRNVTKQDVTWTTATSGNHQHAQQIAAPTTAATWYTFSASVAFKPEIGNDPQENFAEALVVESSTAGTCVGHEHVLKKYTRIDPVTTPGWQSENKSIQFQLDNPGQPFCVVLRYVNGSAKFLDTKLTSSVVLSGTGTLDPANSKIIGPLSTGTPIASSTSLDGVTQVLADIYSPDGNTPRRTAVAGDIIKIDPYAGAAGINSEGVIKVVRRVVNAWGSFTALALTDQATGANLIPAGSPLLSTIPATAPLKDNIVQDVEILSDPTKVIPGVTYTLSGAGTKTAGPIVGLAPYYVSVQADLLDAGGNALFAYGPGTFTVPSTGVTQIAVIRRVLNADASFTGAVSLTYELPTTTATPTPTGTSATATLTPTGTAATATPTTTTSTMTTYFTESGRTTPLTSITAAPGEQKTIAFYLDTKGNNINSFDVTVNLGNALSFGSIASSQEGSDASKFDTTVAKTITSNNIIHFAKRNTTTTPISGTLQLALLTYTAASAGNGTVAVTDASVIIPPATTATAVDKGSFTYTISGTTASPSSIQLTFNKNIKLQGNSTNGAARGTPPTTTTKELKVELYDTTHDDSTDEPIARGTGNIVYDPATTNFGTETASITVRPIGSTTLTPGTVYTLKVKTPKYLKKRAGTITIPTATPTGTTTTVTIPVTQTIILLAGDVTNQNVINIQGYNILIDCGAADNFPPPQTNPVSATVTKYQNCGKHITETLTTASVDLNDDGFIDAIDLGLLTNNLRVQHGD